MIVWMILLAILSFLILLSLIRIKIIIEYNDSLMMQVRILHVFRIPISPKKEKKVKLSDYTENAISKREKKRRTKEKQKELKKQAKQEKKLEEKKRKKEHPEEFKNERTLTENIQLITDLVGVLLRRFFRHLRVDLSRIHISVATGDAAKTAILYGVVCQSVAYLLELMDSIKTVSAPDHSAVSVTADWLGETPKVDIKLSFSLRVWHIFDIVLHTIGRLIKHLFGDMMKKRRSKNDSLSSRRPPNRATPISPAHKAQHHSNGSTNQ